MTTREEYRQTYRLVNNQLSVEIESRVAMGIVGIAIG